MGSQENGRYWGIFEEHGKIHFAEGDTPDYVRELLKPEIERAKRTYPNFDWAKSLKIREVVEEII